MKTSRLLTALALGLGVALGLLWLLAGRSTLPVSAISSTVSNTNDSGAGSLRQAIIDANGDPGPDTIDFSVTGVITLQSPLPAIAEPLTVSGPGAAQLAVSGDNQYRVFSITNGVAVTITGLTVRDGSADEGGGIWSAGDLHLEGVRVISNSADWYGGGVYVWRDTARLDVSGGRIEDNSTNWDGGGVFVHGGSATLSGTHVISNSAKRDGGGVYVFDGSATLDVSRIGNNSTGSDGGGVLVHSGRATLNGTHVISNSAKHDGGGVCIRWDAATLAVSDGGIEGNSAGDAGGGVYVLFGSATLSETQVRGNSADHGGGGFVWSDTAALNVNGGRIEGNSADQGGGVCVWAGGATLSGTQVISNSARLSGGGLHLVSGGAITATDGCIVHNSAPDLSLDKSPDAVAEPGGPVTYTLTFSNTGILAVHNAGIGTLNATDNWWGAADGASGAGPGSGDAVGANVDVSNHKNAPNGCPTLSTSAITATGVVITDIVPVSVTRTSVVSAADAAIAPQAGTRYVWHLDDLGWREGGTITVTGVLSEPLAAGTFTNTAVIAAAADGNPENDRSSAAVTVLPPTRGTIVIEKMTDPAGGRSFTFTTDIPGGPGLFNLDDGHSRTFDDVLAGVYTVTETDLATTPGVPVLTDVVCVETGTRNSFGSLAARAATINLQGGETVTCAFTNTLLDIDGDGVLDDVEDRAPNGGDGDDDGTPDRLQGHVASLPNAEDGRYVTLEAGAGRFTDVEAVGNPSPGDAPPVTFPYGFFSFVITGVTPAGSDVEVTLILPEDVPVTMEYWKHGPTAVDPLDHWYQLPLGDNDGDDGRSRPVTVDLTDGDLGDDDLTPDGDIEDPGGPGQPSPVGGVTRPASGARLRALRRSLGRAPWVALVALATLLLVGAAVVGLRRGFLQDHTPFTHVTPH